MKIILELSSKNESKLIHVKRSSGREVVLLYKENLNTYESIIIRELKWKWAKKIELIKGKPQ